MTKRTRGKEIKGKGSKNNKEKPKSVIYVLYEGETEKVYLKYFETKEYNVYVTPVDPKHTDALGIVRFAKENYIDVPKKIKLDAGDRVYCVFDSDPKSNPNVQIKEAFNLIKGNKSKGLECIFSNPCFEVWFVMHYKSAPAGKSAAQMKAEIKELLEKRENIKNYKEITDIFEILLPHQEKALKRATELHESQHNAYNNVLSHECNPYTNIFEFIQYIEECKKNN